jgi:hypothetical protein
MQNIIAMKNLIQQANRNANHQMGISRIHTWFSGIDQMPVTRYIYYFLYLVSHPVSFTLNPQIVKRLIVLLAIAFCTLLSVRSYSQEKNDSTYRVETVDGNEYIGKIISRDSSGITMTTAQLGTITIKASDIKKVTVIGAIRIENGRAWLDNPQSTKYFLAPNGYGLKKGEGYYQNVWIFFNQFTYGITNYFSIGAGIVPLFLFAGAETPVWINPKVSIPIIKDKFNLGVGVLAGTVIGLENSGFGILYGTGTIGDRDRNVSFGIGWGYSDGGLTHSPSINFSLLYRTSPKWYFISENYYIGVSGEPIGILSFGSRYVTRKLGIDFGLFIPFQKGMDGFAAGPWLGINVPFGRR